MLSLSEKITILLILLSSQVFPGNNLFFITTLSIASLIILLTYYVDIQKSRIPFFLIGSICFTFFTLLYQYEEIGTFIRQVLRLFYPWVLLFVYHLLITKNVKNVEKLYSIVKFTSFSILIILIPDFLSLIYNFFTNFNNLIILKLSSITYRETNTTAFLLLYVIIFRIENKFSNIRENLFSIGALFLTFSRSSILFIFVYALYKLFLNLTKNIKYFNFKLLFARTFPLLVIILMIVIWKFAAIQMEVDSGYSASLNDKSFISRILMLDYLKYYLSTIDSSNFANFLFGYGWIGYSEILGNLPFEYDGTTGHTILGVLPEYGLIYTSSLFLFFYYRAFKGLITDSLLLGLAILAFFPFPYLSPILCLAHSQKRLFKELKYK